MNQLTKSPFSKRSMRLRAREAANRLGDIGIRTTFDRTGWRSLAMLWRKRRSRAGSMAIGRGMTAKFSFEPILNFHFSVFHKNVTSYHIENSSTVSVQNSLSVYRSLLNQSSNSIVTISHVEKRSRRQIAGRATAHPAAHGDTEPNWPARLEIAKQSLFRCEKIQELNKGLAKASPTLVRKNVYKPVSTTWISFTRNNGRRPTSSTQEMTTKPYLEPQVQFNRFQELVWRKVTKSGENAEIAYMQEKSEGEALSKNNDQGRSAAVASVAAVDTGVQRSLTKIDPVLTDRLVDDVMRKMDRRLRIERERRGL